MRLYSITSAAYSNYYGPPDDRIDRSYTTTIAQKPDCSAFLFLCKDAQDAQTGLELLSTVPDGFDFTYCQEWGLTINDNVAMDSKRDVPIVLNSISYEDNYQGDFTTRRALIYTLSFTAKFYLYGPVTSSKVIKTVQVDQYTDLEVNSPKREQRLTVTPNPSGADADDDFGFNETTSFFTDAKTFNPVTGEDE